MCFSPQWRAFFRHRNFKKCSETDVFCTLSLQNALVTTAAWNFWFILWPPASAPAALTGLLFDWPDTRIIEKTQHFATSLTFGTDVFFSSDFRAIASSFCWLDYSTLLFNCPYCRKFLFKLPSINHFQNCCNSQPIFFCLPSIGIPLPRLQVTFPPMPC